jgi:RNA polymerase sigma-70 factor, ECF subfamily
MAIRSIPRRLTGNIFKRAESDQQRGASEADLLERLRGMDAVAWSRVTRHYRRGIFYACLRIVRNQTDAEDVCSQAFVRAVSQIRQFRGDASFKTWLHTIAYNLCMTHLAAASRFKSAGIGSISAPGSNYSDLVSNEPSADRLIASAEVRSAFDRAMATIDPELSNAFHLREIEGLSYEEIARVTGAPANTVKTRIFRARVQLRKLLMEHR